MKKLIYISIIATLIAACSTAKNEQKQLEPRQKKAVVYQVFTRLFGNTNTNNKPWGTIEQNGVGKFNDFTDKALGEIKKLGVTHIWYTGVPHHATITDYTDYGISNDDPDVVKGRAGSPYAVKDYYQVDPDMAVDPSNRMEEFEALIERTHKQGMKVIIDIVPNHVARHYESLNNPDGIKDFGAEDNTSVEYAQKNNFYYIPNESFKVPEAMEGYKPLGGEKHALADGKFAEYPAKWTGNGSRLAQPGHYDWYETVKVNYGVRPDGTFDFDVLPDNYETKDYRVHYTFWQGKELPDSWIKFRDIAFFWLDKGVDGFRYDMAEMVPVEFWSFMNSSVKMKNTDAFLLAEVYQPGLYRDYILKGKMDYLYDKVDLYDTLKHIMQGHGSTDHIAPIQHKLADIEHHMLHFLENHDEQRIASPEFAGDARKGMPAMVVSATLSTSPTMLYFGQEVGEPGAEDAGFGSHSRTSIFDYIGVPHHQRWMNNGKFDGGQLSEDEKELRDFYKRLMTFTAQSDALMGDYADIHAYNRNETKGYTNKVYSCVRWREDEKLIIVSNFNTKEGYEFELKLPVELVRKMDLKDGEYAAIDQLYQIEKTTLTINGGIGVMKVKIAQLQSFIFKWS
ncbi:alpha-amylase family protein [Saccharicrinis sp. GN24d3]|uniref:alpha-amylase family protein n=1 Tax=Saccharicrinis sp. GN24d3 TaxID=3458416 RepID=UPI004036EEF2